MTQTRQQLTLFLKGNESESIEFIRQKFNPVQFGLIKAHITLCREDEITNIEAVQGNLRKLTMETFALETGKASRFSKGKGVYITMLDREGLFRRLRKEVLHDINSQPREHEAHITLMHPRNSTCTDETFEEITNIQLPPRLSITKISLIEQEIGKEWRILEEYHLSMTG